MHSISNRLRNGFSFSMTKMDYDCFFIIGQNIITIDTVKQRIQHNAQIIYVNIQQLIEKLNQIQMFDQKHVLISQGKNEYLLLKFNTYFDSIVKEINHNLVEKKRKQIWELALVQSSFAFVFIVIQVIL